VDILIKEHGRGGFGSNISLKEKEENMTINDILKAVISAAIAYLVPSLLKKAEQGLDQKASLPWLRWIIFGALGGAAGGLVSALMGLVLGGVGNWAAFGMCIGLAQWAALRSYRPVGAWWALASTLGWALFSLGGAWGWIVSGLIVGILQSFSMRKYTGAAWWIIANQVAWWIAGAIGLFVGAPMLAGNPALAWLVGWAVVGLLGAAILIVPLTQIKTKNQPPAGN
jgi:hypothetical protein